MGAYNVSFWKKLTPKQKYLFCKQLIYLTRAKGTYYYINLLFKKIDSNSIIQFQDNILTIKTGLNTSAQN
jgi:hypothetical protein